MVAWTGVGIFYMKGDFAIMVDNLDNLLIMAALAGGRATRAAIVTGFILASLVVLIVASLAIVIAALGVRGRAAVHNACVKAELASARKARRMPGRTRAGGRG